MIGIWAYTDVRPTSRKRLRDVQESSIGGAFGRSTHIFKFFKQPELLPSWLRPDVNGIQRYPGRHVQQKATVGVHMPE
jgi:hypothetical protein